MNRKTVKVITAIILIAVLLSLIAIAFISDMSFPLQVFISLSCVYGFYEIYNWIKK